MVQIEPLLLAVGGFFGGLYGLLYGFKMYRRYQLIRDTPTSTVQSLSVGTVELTGTVKQQREEHLYNNPITDAVCVYYRREVEKYHEGKNGNGTWDTIFEEQVGDSFYLDDGTGAVRVTPNDPDIDLEDNATKQVTMTVNPNNDIPNALKGTSASDSSGLIPDFLEGEKYRVTVESIQPEMDVYVFGKAQAAHADEAAVTNEDNIVVGNPAAPDSGWANHLRLVGRSKPFIIANQDEDNLISERKWLGPASFFGGLLVSAGCLAYLLTLFGV